MVVLWLSKADGIWKQLVRKPQRYDYCLTYSFRLDEYVVWSKMYILSLTENLRCGYRCGQGNTNDITFTRRYLDQNRVTYEVKCWLSCSDLKSHGDNCLVPYANVRPSIWHHHRTLDHSWTASPCGPFWFVLPVRNSPARLYSLSVCAPYMSPEH